MPCIHPDTRFRNGSRAAKKWRETTPNLSFGAKEVDWARSLQKNKKWYRGHKLMPCIHLDTRFCNGSRVATKWRETTRNLSFVPKEVDWACSLRKARNGSYDTNSCLVSTPMLVFAMLHVRQRNGAKPLQT